MFFFLFRLIDYMVDVFGIEKYSKRYEQAMNIALCISLITLLAWLVGFVYVSYTWPIFLLYYAGFSYVAVAVLLILTHFRDRSLNKWDSLNFIAAPFLIFMMLTILISGIVPCGPC